MAEIQISRRAVLAGASAIAATSAAGLAVSTTPVRAADPPTTDEQQVPQFVELSAALTGIDVTRLASSAQGIQLVYFKRAKKERPALFPLLLQTYEQHKNQSPAPFAVADLILNKSGAPIRYLARSIMIAWYLGQWCDPDELQKYDSPTPPSDAIGAPVISSAAYTDGWVWRVAQAHPMGYSDLRFGYWAEQPLPRAKFIEKEP